MSSYAELQSSPNAERTLRVALPDDIARDIAFRQSDGWITALLDALMSHRPRGCERFVEALDARLEEATVLFEVPARSEGDPPIQVVRWAEDIRRGSASQADAASQGPLCATDGAGRNSAVVGSVELRAAMAEGLAPFRIDLPAAVVNRVATAPRGEWVAALAQAVARHNPTNRNDFLRALQAHRGDGNAVVAFLIDKAGCRSFEGVRTLAELPGRRIVAGPSDPTRPN